MGFWPHSHRRRTSLQQIWKKSVIQRTSAGCQLVQASFSRPASVSTQLLPSLHSAAECVDVSEWAGQDIPSAQDPLRRRCPLPAAARRRFFLVFPFPLPRSSTTTSPPSFSVSSSSTRLLLAEVNGFLNQLRFIAQGWPSLQQLPQLPRSSLHVFRCSQDINASVPGRVFADQGQARA